MAEGRDAAGAPCDEVSTWAHEIESVIASDGITIINRVRVLAETASTQDAAWRDAAGFAGLLVTAGRQTAGRGRLGRAWADTSHLGVAATFVLDAGAWTIPHVSLAAGLAAARACARTLRADAGDTAILGIRWPNDVVERGAGRKVSGVLIESRDGLLLVGIGINVLQRAEDFPLELRARAVSLSDLRAESGVASGARRVDVLGSLVRELDRALRTDDESLVRAWARHDVLTGRRATFIANGREISGEIVDIDPRAQLRVRVGGGEIIALDALSTSLIHERLGPAAGSV